MGLVKTRRLAAMQKQQRAKAGAKPLAKPGLKKDAWPAAPFGPARLAARRDSPRFAGAGAAAAGSGHRGMGFGIIIAMLGTGAAAREP